jgi:hypothetical protein
MTRAIGLAIRVDVAQNHAIGALLFDRHNAAAFYE